MKKIAALITIMIILSTIAGCLYDGKHQELYQMTRFNVLATNGVGETDKVKIEVLEEDLYGRILFTYTMDTSRTYGYGRIWVVAICQKSDRKLTYYYEDECFIISDAFENFSEEDINNLKLNNDWDKPVNENKLSSRPIYPDYDGYSGTIAYNIIRLYKGVSKDNKVGVRFTDYDGEGKILCLAVEYDADYDDDIEVTTKYYLMIFNEDGTYNKDTFVVEIEDLYNYQELLHEFKISNDWNFS